MSGRSGGFSSVPYEACNLGTHVGDDPTTVARNRAFLAQQVGAVPAPLWLNQVHGNRVLRLHADHLAGPVQDADGAVCTEPGLACTVMVADCLPLLLAAPHGRGVAALHAGWRGLAGAGAMAGHGIAEAGVAALCEVASCDPADLRAWLGPCIGPAMFEVGAEVLAGFGVDAPAQAHTAVRHPRFAPRAPRLGDPTARWLADLPGLARDRLVASGVRPDAIGGGAWCTVSEPSRFFSFRRDGVTGRQAACIWLA